MREIVEAKSKAPILMLMMCSGVGTQDEDTSARRVESQAVSAAEAIDSGACSGGVRDDVMEGLNRRREVGS